MQPLSIAVVSPSSVARGGLSTYLDALEAEVRHHPAVSMSFIEIPYERDMLDPATAAAYLTPRVAGSHVIHANDYFASAVTRRAATGIPVATTLHLLHSAYPYAGVPVPSQDVERLEQEAATQSDATIAVSQWMGDQALRLGATRQRVRVVPNGMSVNADSHDLKLGRKQSETSSGQQRPLALCFSGRLVEQKGADLLLPLLHALAEQPIAWTLDICGDGPWWNSVSNAIHAEGFSPRVRLSRWLDPHAMHETFAASDFTISLTRHEPFGLSFLESIACGTPVVGIVRDGMSEYCRSGVNCVPCVSVPEIARTVTALASGKLMLPQRPQIQHSVRHFTWRRTLDETLDVYRLVAA